MAKLRRALSLFEATLYGIGIIIGAGIYALIGQATALAGNAIWMSFLIGAIVASFTGLSYAELSAMYPKAAAEFVYVKKAYHNKFFAFLIGWLIIFTGVVSVATVALGFSGYFKTLFAEQITSLSGVYYQYMSNYLLIVISAILIGVLSFVNYRGIRESSRLNMVLTAASVLGLLVIVALGFGSLERINYFEMPNGITGVLSAAALIFFAYIGFEEVVNISEETKSPRKFIPIALIIAVIVTAILYVLTAISVINLADWREVGSSSAPLAFAASKSMLGGTAFLFLSVLALFATSGTVLIILAVVARMMYGMARDGTLPRILSKVHSKYKTPWAAGIAVMLISILLVSIGDIKFVADITSFGALFTFLVINISVIWIRHTHPRVRRPFKIPLNIKGYPIPAFIGILSCSLLLLQFQRDLVALTVASLVVGAGAFEARRRKLI